MKKQNNIGQCVAMPIDKWTPEMVESALKFKSEERERIKKEIETLKGYSTEELFRNASAIE